MDGDSRMPPRRPTSSSKDTLPKAPILILSGTDTFKIKQTVQRLIEREGGDDSCERRDYDAAQDETRSALTDAASPSLFVPSRVIVIHNLDKAKVDSLEALLNYVKQPATDSTLVLVLGSKGSPKKALKELLTEVPVVEIAAASRSDIRSLIVRRFKEAKIAIDKDAFDLLLEQVGDRGEDALGEVEKMILWAGEGNRIDLETCQKLLTTEAEEEIWATTRAVGEKNSAKALISLRRALDQGLDSFALLGMLARSFRQMWSLRVAKEEGIPQQKLSQVTGLKGYALQATARQVQGFSRTSLEHGLARIRETDIAIKGGSSLPEMALERLVVELCSGD